MKVVILYEIKSFRNLEKKFPGPQLRSSFKRVSETTHFPIISQRLLRKIILFIWKLSAFRLELNTKKMQPIQRLFANPWFITRKKGKIKAKSMIYLGFELDYLSKNSVNFPIETTRVMSNESIVMSNTLNSVWQWYM